ncbi:MAG: repair protein RecN [Pseudomonadota bacterium]|jgi:DNA repair protein RecN (Recombination protein N)
MLSELTVSNFAIIERQSLTFHPHFNVISGETGAGKSIILNALEFILGAKGSTTLIRSGADQMEVQALFDLSEIPQTIRAELPEIVGEGDELVVSRTQPREGRGKVLINGRLGTVSLLEEIVRKLVNICSQHHQTRLLDAKYHLELLDGYADNARLTEKVREAYELWHAAKCELLSLETLEASGAQRREELQHTFDELSALPKLKAGRRAELEGEIKRIGNFERLNQAGQRALDLLTGDEGLGVKLREVSAVLADLRRYDAATATIINEFEVARDALTRSELAIGRYVHTIDADTSSLEDLREELSELARLERKYRTDDAGLCERREKAQDELAKLGGGLGLQALEKDVASKFAAFKTLALDLRKIRQKAAKSLMTSVTDALAELNMADARLEVRFGECEASAKGIDRVDFLMSSNKGESHGALSQIASGGELSRVMLVLKKVLREQSGVNVLIFDEVDTGISGGVARAVGRMLKDIGSQSQVICITHLPQVASLSDKHFLVQKEIGDRAVTVVRALTEGEKVDEIARMLAGFTITEASRASARELIESR